jgi:hypothetical protein
MTRRCNPPGNSFNSFKWRFIVLYSMSYY